MPNTKTANGNWVTVSFKSGNKTIKGKFRAVLVSKIKSKEMECTPYFEIGNKFEKGVTPQFKVNTNSAKLGGDTDISFDDDIEDINQQEHGDYYKDNSKWSKKWMRNSNVTSETKVKKYKLHKAYPNKDTTAGLRVRIKYTYTTGSGKKKKTHTKYSSYSEVRVNYAAKPAVPKFLDYEDNVGTDSAIRLKAAFPASFRAPVKGAVLEKQQDTSQDSWSGTGRSTTFVSASSEGAINGDNIWNVTDQKISAGTKWRYRVGSRNSAGTSYAQTQWVYGEPPSVNEFSAQRSPSNKNTAILHVSRPAGSCARSLIRGYYIEYNNDPDDVGVGTKWKKLIRVTDDNNNGRATRAYTVQIDSGITVQTTDGKNAKNVPWTAATLNEFDFIHKNLTGDTGYRYRLRTINRTNRMLNGKETDDWQESMVYSPSVSGTEIIYTPPNPPKSVTATLNTDLSRLITITKVNNKTTADTMHIERKLDGNDWVSITGSEGIAIADTYTDSELIEARSIVYRVAFANRAAGLEKTGWRESSELIILQPPNPPTLTSPINGTKVNIEASYHRLVWIHNPKDMRNQTAYKIDVSFDSQSWYTIDGTGDASYYDLTSEKLQEIAVELGHGLAEKDSVYWRAKTQATEEKGFGEWSEVFSFIVIGKPKVTMITPGSDEVITRLPLHLEWSYIDNSGDEDPIDVTISIEKNHKVLKTYKLEDLTARSYDIIRYLFDNNETYTISLTFVSSSTYSAQVSFNIFINYAPVTLAKGLSLNYTFNETYGYTTVDFITPLPEERWEDPEVVVPDDVEEDAPGDIEDLPNYEDDAEVIEPDPEIIDSPLYMAYLYRNYDGEKTLIKSLNTEELGGTEDIVISFKDYYAPINRPFTYELLQMAENGGISLTSYDVYFGEDEPILWWYVIWEVNGETESVRSRWNPSINISLSRPEKQEVRYSGRKYPVVYDSTARSETASYTMTLFEDDRIEDNGWEALRKYRQLMHDGAHGVWKSFEGDVYTADFDFTYSANYSNKIRSWNCTLNVTRTESEENNG